MIIATPKIRSMCKIITDGKTTFAGQVIVSDTDTKSRDTYAIRLLHVKPNQLVLDKENIYKFVDSGWRATALSDHTCDAIKSAMEPIIRSYAHLFVKDISKNKDRTKLCIWEDTVIRSAAKCSDSHRIKIGDRVFDTHSALDITDPRWPNHITYTVIGDASRSTYKLLLSDDPKTAKRLMKQFEIADRQYERSLSSKLCGGMSIAAAQNARKEFGQSNRSHRELRRAKG